MIARRNIAPDHATGVVNFDAIRARNGFDRFSWDNLRLFLAVAEAGSFRSAASVAGVSINTIRTKVERLERQIGGPLLRRSVEGVALTQDGRELLQIAREMRDLGRTTARVGQGAALRDAAVRLVVTEGVGTAWLLPRLVALQLASPDVRVALMCATAAADVLFSDVDLALQLQRPSDPSLVVEQIATLHFAPFASEAYAARCGLPTSAAELAAHRLVWQTGDPDAIALLDQALGGDSSARNVAFETNTGSAHHAAVAQGAGIGFLPTSVAMLDDALHMIGIGVTVRRPLYLVHRDDAIDHPAIATVLDGLRDAFDPERYPVFADEFARPEPTSTHR